MTDDQIVDECQRIDCKEAELRRIEGFLTSMRYDLILKLRDKRRVAECGHEAQNALPAPPQTTETRG